jgi:hypothetical protein
MQDSMSSRDRATSAVVVGQWRDTMVGYELVGAILTLAAAQQAMATWGAV